MAQEDDMTKKIETKAAKTMTTKSVDANSLQVVKSTPLKKPTPTTAFADLAAVLRAKKAGRLPHGFKLTVAKDWVTAEVPGIEIEFSMTPNDFVHAAAKMLGMKSADA